MKRFAYVAIATLVLAFGVGACKKAHDAGNDSMNAGHSSISAANGQSDSVRATALAGSAAIPTGIQKSRP